MTSPPDPLAMAQRDLGEVAAAPLAEQAEIFDRVHRTLVEALDTASPPVPAPPGNT